MPLVTVVMPTYNVAAYLEQALDSLLAQTFSDWECVVVDDGSTDHTSNIIKEYAARDSRIRFRLSSSNSGSAKLPRDTAISMAKGEWIMALDADDALASDAIERLIERQKETGADFVALQMINTDQSLRPTGNILPKKDFDTTQVIDGKQAMMLTIGKWEFGANGALINKRLWNERKSTSFHMNADEYDSRDMLLRSDKVAFSRTSSYYYRNYPFSISKTFNSKQFEPLITDSMLVKLLLEHFGIDSPQYKTIETVFQRNLLGCYMKYAIHCKKLDEQGCKKAKQLIFNAKKEAPPKKVLASGLPWIGKAILILPSSVIFVIAKIVSKLIGTAILILPSSVIFVIAKIVSKLK